MTHGVEHGPGASHHSTERRVLVCAGAVYAQLLQHHLQLLLAVGGTVAQREPTAGCTGREVVGCAPQAHARHAA